MVEDINDKKSVVWFTGLSGSGKSTLANALAEEFRSDKLLVTILDGDEIRKGLSSDLGFSTEDRAENVRRVSEVAKLFMLSGHLVLVALITPLKSDRALAKEIIGKDVFVEVFVDTPLSVCEARDIKGLYKKARDGSVKNFTAIHSRYERPDNADIVIKHTTCASNVESLNEADILNMQVKNLYDFLLAYRSS